jgi:hypothetical protein
VNKKLESVHSDAGRPTRRQCKRTMVGIVVATAQIATSPCRESVFGNHLQQQPVERIGREGHYPKGAARKTLVEQRLRQERMRVKTLASTYRIG